MRNITIGVLACLLGIPTITKANEAEAVLALAVATQSQLEVPKKVVVLPPIRRTSTSVSGLNLASIPPVTGLGIVSPIRTVVPMWGGGFFTCPGGVCN